MVGVVGKVNVYNQRKDHKDEWNHVEERKEKEKKFGR